MMIQKMMGYIHKSGLKNEVVMTEFFKKLQRERDQMINHGFQKYSINSYG